jgi:tRNA(fMet)-specific endonuclease VapC
LALIRRVKTQTDAARTDGHLRATIPFCATIRILLDDAAAVAQFEAVRQQDLRIGTQDFRIAAICLTQQATRATRNQRDFGQVPGLSTEDWSHAETS